ncbi:NADH-quinone oxidoreductase subunit C [Actinoalloteichus spitiensis]|uniref:NADH-quinone oxidoreductase subunit C n=1 Tax=Actinoalloteichus spitiensis TaxID=252394 RepID=UPI000378188B|nr:NADH-quinone oxidoreductase subunit C [Actinoalloteichus spitiensis]
MRAGSAALAEELSRHLPDADVAAEFGQHAVSVPLASWRDAARAAHGALGCALFDWLGAEDAGGPTEEPGRAHRVTLHVVNPSRRLGLLLRTRVLAGEALPSLHQVWDGAAWHERELAEMFGLDVTGLATPPLLLAPTFVGHPLRKDFVLASRATRPWPGAPEPGESAADAATGGRRRGTPPGVPDPSWGPRRERS